MKAPLKWLLAYTDLEYKDSDEFAANIASLMTLSGSKVETVDKLESKITRVVVGKCVKIERHQNSDHMFVCQMDVGSDFGGVIQIVTGAQNVKLGDHIPVALDNSVISGGREIKSGKLRGEVSDGMMCSFEELGLSSANFEGGIDDGVIVLEDLKLLGGKDYDSFIGKDIMEVLDVCYKDYVIDFEITSNRADCFSITGLAREAAVTMGAKFVMPKIEVKETAKGSAKDSVSVSVEDSDLCPAYFARTVKNVKIAPSPKWMRERLEAAGVRSINNIVDITNYVMLEMGQPMHAFDKRTVRGDKIIVRRAKEGEIFRTLDGQDRTLNANMLVISDAIGAIGIAGVMGGENSEIRPDTTEIVFESATFDAVTVRRGAKSVGLRTESSSRFEKGLDPMLAYISINRAAQLVEELGAGEVEKGIVEVKTKDAFSEREVPFDPAKINAFLGTDIPTEKMVEILENLECRVKLEKKVIVPPYFRHDLICIADVAEEIARFYGYNNIESTLLKNCEMTLGSRTKIQRIRDVIRNRMSGSGFREMLTYSFESPNVYDKLMLPADDPHRNFVKISNPLGEDYSAMRTSMAPTVLRTLSFNYAQRNKAAWLFEIAYVYLKYANEEELPEHREQLAIGAYGNMDFFKLKGVLEALFDELKLPEAEYVASNELSFMHPGRTADIYIGGKKIGYAGQVHPLCADNYEAPRDSYIAVLDLKPLAEGAVEIPKGKELPKFPAVTRDLAVVLDKKIPQGEVIKIIRQRGGKLLESCELFDCYEGIQVGIGKKSLAYSLCFRSSEGTLTDDDIDKQMKKILNGLTNIGAELR
ncbi:MAG: phenylalanine--tRNA ligase subunit beta [Clostridia bacterium]|nr:phenylalanine--tRNA ligase subunit beta [Clostridia bacterium]